MKFRLKSLSKNVGSIAIAGVLLFAATTVLAASGQNLATIAQNIQSNFSALAKLITAGSYIVGFSFAFGAILKFKAHKDNPQQNPIGTPIALLFVAAALIFLPSVFGVSGRTIFGGSGTPGTISGTTSVPGFNK